jgi:pyridoxal phosphate enzyme (YggS family)
MIGHVQSRKARLVAEHFDWLHSLDSVKLAGRLDRVCVELDRRLPVLLECNVSGEESKFGWPAWDENNWPELLEPVSAILAMPGLDVRGLMTMAPFLDEAEQARPFFRRLRLLLEYFTGQFPQARWEELSMGMSADFPVAVQEGATLVRVGTAIMGERPAVATPEAA